MRHEENAYQSWLWGEILLFGLLGATLALFATYPGLRPTFELPQVRLVLDTMVALAAVLVAVLAGVRFSVDGRRLDWLLCAGFSLAAGATFCFGIAPVLSGVARQRPRPLARPRRDLVSVRRSALRLHAARLESLRLDRRLSAPGCLRGPARRRLARDSVCRVRPGGRGGTCT